MSSPFNSIFSKLVRSGLVVILFVLALPQLSKAQNANQPVFNHMALCAKNLRKTADFYRNVIQLQEIKHPFSDTVHVWLKVGEGLSLHIIQGDCSANAPDIGVHLCFAVPNLDAFIKHLEAINVSYANWAKQPKKIQLRTDGVKQIYLQDPDGFWVEVNDSK
jgi:lactoylglutathione lyase